MGASDAEVTDVVTVIVEATALEPRITEFGANEHAAAVGSPEQVSVTGALNGGFDAAKLSPNVALCPRDTVCETVVAVRVNSGAGVGGGGGGGAAAVKNSVISSAVVAAPGNVVRPLASDNILNRLWCW